MGNTGFEPADKDLFRNYILYPDDDPSPFADGRANHLEPIILPEKKHIYLKHQCQASFFFFVQKNKY